MDDLLTLLSDFGGAGTAPCRDQGNVDCSELLEISDALLLLKSEGGIGVLQAVCPPPA
jgi:hypothetical protein